MEPYTPYSNSDLITHLPHDVASNVLDIPLFVKFSITCRDARKYSNHQIINEFRHLLDYCAEKFESNPHPLEKYILAKWTKIKSSMESKQDESGCTELKLFKEAFDLLKIFYNIIPAKSQAELLKQRCPFLIKEMIAFDSGVISSCALSAYKQIAYEFKKMGMFCEGNPDEHPYKDLPFNGYIGGSLHLIEKAWFPSLNFATFKNQNISSKVLAVDFFNSKWENIKIIYSKCFGELQNHIMITPLNDLKGEWQKKQIYQNNLRYVTKIFNISEVDLLLKESEFCLRSSGSEKDVYGSPKIVIEYKNINKNPICTYFDITAYGSVEELDAALTLIKSDLQKKITYEKIRYSVKKSSKYIDENNPYLEKNKYCIRPTGAVDQKDIYGNPKMVLSYKHPNGDTLNCRLDLTTFQSIKELEVHIKEKLDYFKVYTK